MGALVGIISRCTLTIEACHRKQPNKSKLALYKPLLYFYNHLNQVTVHKYVTRWSISVIKVGMSYVGVKTHGHVSAAKKAV